MLLKADQGLEREEQTGFIMGPVSYAVQREIMPMILSGNVGAAIWVDRLLKECLKGVEEDRPLRDEDGEPIPFATDKKGRVKESFLERLDFNDRVELAENRLKTFMTELADDEAVEADDLEKSEPASPGQ